MARLRKYGWLLLVIALALGAALVTVGGSVYADDGDNPAEKPPGLTGLGTTVCDNTNDGGVMKKTAEYILIDVDCWHSGWCWVCDEYMDYGCSTYKGNDPFCWFSPCPFADPVPDGNIVTKIEAEIRGVGRCMGGSNLTEVYVNHTLVGSKVQHGNCSCGRCNPLLVSSPTYGDGFPGYVYGGKNKLGLEIDGQSCISDVHLTIYYGRPRFELEPEGPGVSPTVTGWSRTLSPAQIGTQFLSVNPQQTYAGQPVTISTNVVNTGDEAGNYNVALKINGQVEETKAVSVGPQGTQPVKFTVVRAEPGTYTVAIDGQQSSFTVLGADNSTTRAPVGGLVIAIVLVGVVVLATVVFLLARRRSA